MTDTLPTALNKLLSSCSPNLLETHSKTPAAVLLLIYLKEGDYCLHLQKRARHLEHHGSEASFPGGTPEAQDENLLQTALRETYEEEGIRPEDVTILGQMNDTPTRTGYVMKVFVGTIPYPYPFRPNPAEVEELIEVPLKALQSADCWREEAYWQDGQIVSTNSYVFGPHIIYGATANIVRQFLDLLLRLQNDGIQ